jgi:hypothetical protein
MTISYDRCTAHRLLRCGVCASKGFNSTSVAPVSAAPPELLDGPGVSSEPIEIDKQAQEAIERNKEIYNLPLEENLTRIYEPALAARPVSVPASVQLPRVIDTPNPVVSAAKEYSEAQTNVLTRSREVDTLRLKLQQAENALKDAEGDREIKKAVLQKLVAN